MSDVLSASIIRSGLSALASAGFADLDVHDEVTSTNALVLDRLRTDSAARMVCIAERQTAGRGRRGRQWHSADGAGIYMTASWTFAQGGAPIDGLSLVVGISVCEALESVGVNGVGLKWPNDLVLEKAKLGGILIEVIANTGANSGANAGGNLAQCGGSQAVIGIGINVRLPSDAHASIDQPFTDLAATGFSGTRNELIVRVLNALSRRLDEFGREGFLPFLADWQRYDVLHGKPVLVKADTHAWPGIAVGVANDGALRVKTDIAVHEVRSGEVSIREQPNTAA